MTAYASEHEEALAIEKKRDVDMAEGCVAVKEWEASTGRKC